MRVYNLIDVLINETDLKLKIYETFITIGRISILVIIIVKDILRDKRNAGKQEVIIPSIVNHCALSYNEENLTFIAYGNSTRMIHINDIIYIRAEHQHNVKIKKNSEIMGCIAIGYYSDKIPNEVYLSKVISPDDVVNKAKCILQQERIYNVK